MSTITELAGAYSIHPHQTPAISGARPILAHHALHQLLSRQPLSQVPHTVSAIFTLCGNAHATVSQLAIDTLSQAMAAPIPTLTNAQKQQLRLSTLHEHIQQIYLTWMDKNDVHTQQAWGNYLQQRSTQLEAHLKTWFSQHVLGQDLAEWWHAWRADGVIALNHWAQTSPSACAKNARAHLYLTQWAHGGDAFIPSTNNLQAIHQHWQAESEFALRPHIKSTPLESGVWSRTHIAHPMMDNAWTRIMARLVDAAELLMDTNANYLVTGCTRITEHTALAWTEMARGVLIHIVELNPIKTAIAQYSVIAPTEWNLHPQGRLAQTLSEDVDDNMTHIKALVSAFDPCVAFNIEDTASCMK
jgi:Ni,Fe-hydrogenase I large subunit